MDTKPEMASLKLASICLKLLERIVKLEFTSLAWKIKAQPLYHTREQPYQANLRQTVYQLYS